MYTLCVQEYVFIYVCTYACLQDIMYGFEWLLKSMYMYVGVAHKERLKASAANTDVLTLSATPIPRTLQVRTYTTHIMHFLKLYHRK